MISGRFLNYKDIHEARKVIVIGERVNEVLFRRKKKALGAVPQNQRNVFPGNVCTNRNIPAAGELSKFLHHHAFNYHAKSLQPG